MEEMTTQQKIDEAVLAERERCAYVIRNAMIWHGDQYGGYVGRSPDSEVLAQEILKG